MKTIVFSFLVLLMLTGCGVSEEEHQQLLKKISTQDEEISRLKVELDEVINGADRLLISGQSFIKQENYQKAKDVLSKLVSKHPNTIQANKALELITEADKKITHVALLKKQKLEQSLKSININNDEMSGKTWYQSQVDANRNSISLYFGVNENNELGYLRLQLVIRFTEWVFANSYLINVDGKRYEKDIELERQSAYVGIRETYDEVVTSKELEMIEKIINSKKATVRFIGDKGYVDHKVSEKEKDALRDIINAYEVIKNSRVSI